MPRPLDARLDRVEERRGAAAGEQGSAAMRRRIWRAEAAMGALIRSELARAGVDSGKATRLCLDDAEAALAALPDTPELQRADSADAAAADADNRTRTDAFEPKLLALMQSFAGAPPPDVANASFAELFAWSLASRQRNNLPSLRTRRRVRDLG
jgi:hypothetical protein